MSQHGPMNAWSQPPSPYAPPGAWTAHPSTYPPPAISTAPGPHAGTVLYTPNQILLAAFLGAPIAGAILMAINEQRLGRPKGVLSSLAIGLVMTAIVIGLAFVLPDNFPGLPLSLLGMGAIRALVQMKQADAVARHLQWGGRKGSGWAAAGIGILGGVFVVVVAIAIALVYVLVTGKEL